VAHYQQAIVLYVGNGTVDRLIETPFPLDSGAVAIWIFEYNGTAEATGPKFRHNDPLMMGTCDVGRSGTMVGITAFTAAGFTVSHQAVGAEGSVNTSGHAYAAVVMRDSAPGGEILRVGVYAGSQTHSATFEIPLAGPLTQIGANTFTAADVGYGFTSVGSPGGLVFTLTSWSGPSAATMWPPWDGAIGNPIVAATQVDNRMIVVGDADWLPTHVWVFGRGVPYRSDDFTGDSSIALSGEFKPMTNSIQRFLTAGAFAGFEIGTDNNVNGSTLTYYWLACRFTPSILAHNFFRSFRITPTAAPIDQVTGLGFLPLVAIALRYGSGSTHARRQPQHTGTQSSSMGGTINAVGGIDALGLGTIDLGEDLAAVGEDVYGFAFAPGDFNTNPTLPAGCPVSFSVPLTTQPDGCPLVDFPH
jgi:hypothetical protein